MDLEHTRYATFDDLREYCWRVASTVGLICLNIFGCRHPGGRDYAMNLGLALQLTNIVRDVATDLGRGRIYLPQDEMARAGCSEAQLTAGTVTPAGGGAARRCSARGPATTTSGRRPRCRLARPGTWWRPRSWARSTSPSCSASSAAASTCSPRWCGCRGPQRAIIAATTWARTLMRAGVEAVAPARTS